MQKDLHSIQGNPLTLYQFFILFFYSIPLRLPYLDIFATVWGERGMYLTMGNDISSIAEEQSHNQTVSTKAQLLKIGEPKRNRTDVRQLTRPAAPYR